MLTMYQALFQAGPLQIATCLTFITLFSICRKETETQRSNSPKVMKRSHGRARHQTRASAAGAHSLNYHVMLPLYHCSPPLTLYLLEQ